MNLTFASLEAWWWPYAFILLAGSLPTNIWRWLGVFVGGALHNDSELLLWVKAVASALIAAVISKLILFPTGPLADTSVLLRVGAAAFGMIAFWLCKKNILVGVVAAEAVLLAALFL
uniref:AzlD domain-containing protein n=1 Tax=Pararhizobium sp. IMCC3301 TaxID=3067904 RepID=UPI002741F76A|nr:AzlD domain-containing protein [Pararhizobium sp. IMCC3301]